ncbi:MAG: hypothetical protein ED557_13940 [Balneola sp.]|nr:MAG: hypothetical protein ED557_13940 [Balneola sp.]
MKRIIIPFIAVLFISLNLSAQNSNDKGLERLALLANMDLFFQDGTKEGEVDLEGISQLEVLVDAGMEITVKGDNSTKLSYKYYFKGNKLAYERYFENFDPEVKRNGGEARFEVDFPNINIKNETFRVDEHRLEITLPSELLLRLRSRYSQIEVENIRLGLEVENRSGTVKARDIFQTVRIYNDYGSIVAMNIQGELFIANRSASIDVQEIIGAVQVNANYSKMNISKVDGDLDITNRSGAVNAFDINGSLTGDGPYVEYELTNIDGDVRIDNKSGKITLNSARSLRVVGDYTHVNASNITSSEGASIEGRSANVDLKNIEGNVMVTGQYLNIDLEKVKGAASISNRSGKLYINDLEKDLTFRGEYVPISARNLRGANLNIDNKSGNMDIETLAVMENVFIKSNYGNVELFMKSKFNGQVKIETKYGKLDSDFTITGEQISEYSNRRIVTGTVGNGNGTMEIITQNANVIIK